MANAPEGTQDARTECTREGMAPKSRAINSPGGQQRGTRDREPEKHMSQPSARGLPTKGKGVGRRLQRPQHQPKPEPTPPPLAPAEGPSQEPRPRPQPEPDQKIDLRDLSNGGRQARSFSLTIVKTGAGVE